MQSCPVLPFMRLTAGIVQNCIDSRLHLIAFCHNEEEGTHAQASILRLLSLMWCARSRALCAAFRRSALSTSCRAEVCRS